MNDDWELFKNNSLDVQKAINLTIRKADCAGLKKVDFKRNENSYLKSLKGEGGW